MTGTVHVGCLTSEYLGRCSVALRVNNIVCRITLHQIDRIEDILTIFER